LPHDQLLEFEIILSHHVAAVVLDLNFVGNCAVSYVVISSKSATSNCTFNGTIDHRATVVF